MPKIGIIVIGYNRINSIKRLLLRLNDCFYENKDVPLIISIDNSGSNEVYNYAESFHWNFGSKTVYTYKNRLGLKNHVLRCGDFIEEHNWDAAVVFEDDTFPSIGFYNFAIQAVAHYSTNESIAGISLYSDQWNVHADLPFQPLKKGESDIYFLQVAQSWGQIWLKEQWAEFKKWYLLHSEFNPSSAVPSTYANWPGSSWLKYHNQYCIEENKFFVYPYEGLSTCFSEVGEHTTFKTNVFQTTINCCKTKKYIFDDLENGIVYDAYFESINIKRSVESNVHDNVTVDLYGQKKKFDSRYILTTNNLPYTVVDSFGLELRPIESNITESIPGSSIKLYDTNLNGHLTKENTSITLWLYMQKQIPNWRTIFDLITIKIHYWLIITKKRLRIKRN